MLLSCATGSEQFLGSEAIASYATAKAVILVRVVKPDRRR